MVENIGGVTRLRYKSASLIDLSDAHSVIQRLLLKARAFNQAHGITGALMSHENKFVQQLEGPKDQVMRLYETISKDTRHNDLSIVSCEDDEERIFSEWSMLLVGDDGETDVPLFASKTTFTTGADQNFTAKQRDELSKLRAIIST